jgi:hypothetical protein
MGLLLFQITCIANRQVEWSVNGELERMSKEEGMAEL